MGCFGLNQHRNAERFNAGCFRYDSILTLMSFEAAEQDFAFRGAAARRDWGVDVPAIGRDAQVPGTCAGATLGRGGRFDMPCLIPEKRLSFSGVFTIDVEGDCARLRAAVLR